MHRDIKPDNILLCGKSEDINKLTAKLADFGACAIIEN